MEALEWQDVVISTVCVIQFFGGHVMTRIWCDKVFTTEGSGKSGDWVE